MRYAAQSPGLLNLLSALVSNETVPASSVWDGFVRSRDSYLLDPIDLAYQFGTAANRQAVENAAAYEAYMGDAPVDRGAATADQLLRRMGFDSNLSEIANPPTTYYPIADDIHYKRQFKPVTGKATKDSRKPGTIVEFINLPNVPMADWDVLGPSHAAANSTVNHLGDVEELVRNYLVKHPQSILKLYATPGGYRAWEVGDPMHVSDFAPRFEELKVDPDYARISQDGGRWTRATDSGEVLIDPAGFRSRISHKPGRVDWVAQPIATLSGREAIPDPLASQLVQQLHDEPIRQAYLGPSGASPDAMAVVKQQLPKVSKTFAAELRNRFRL